MKRKIKRVPFLRRGTRKRGGHIANSKNSSPGEGCLCVEGAAVGGASEPGAGLKLKQLSGRGLRCSQATPCLSKVWLT